MKFKDYLNSLVSKRKTNTTTSKSHQKSMHKKSHHELTTSTDCHYDICAYEDVNGIVTDDQRSRTQVLLARHAELVNIIVGTRSSNDNTFSSCSQCRMSHQPSPVIPPPLPPPISSKLALEQQISFSNCNYSSTLATSSPCRECQNHHHHEPQQQQKSHHISSPYSTPNPSAISSSSNSLLTATTTMTNLSTKQRSRIRTNPWIGTSSTNNRSSTVIEPSNGFHRQISPPIPPSSHPEYGIYDPTFGASPSGLIHSETFPQTTSNGNTHLTNSPQSPQPIAVPMSTPAPVSTVILHQSDSGHGFSLPSSKAIDSSSSSPSSPSSSSTSSPSSSFLSSSSSAKNRHDSDALSNGKQHYRQKKFKKKRSSSLLGIQRSSQFNTNTGQYLAPNPVSSDGVSLTRHTKVHQMSPSVAVQCRYQRPLSATKTNLIKTSIDRINHDHKSCSSSSRSTDDHFSLEFEEILENERSYKQRRDKQLSTKLMSPKSISPRKSPFILPLDETNIKLPSPPPIVLSSSLTKTNSRAILKHIEEIENEIRLIKNLDLANHDNENDNDYDDDDDAYLLSSHACSEEDIDFRIENIDHDDDNDVEEEINDKRQSIYDQVDLWVEKCLNTTNNTNNPAARLHTECDHLSTTIKDYVVCVCSNDYQRASSVPISSTPENASKLMTAFYLSSVPAQLIKRRTSSFIDKPSNLEKSRTVTHDLNSIHECPF